MSKVDLLLSRLEKVKKTGPDSWIACCPAHKDKHPSITIKELPDGRILIHCFADCSPQNILDSVGLQFGDLFPDKVMEHGGKLRRPFLPTEIFDIARQEIAVVAIIASDLHKNRYVTEGDYQRLYKAVDRLNGIAQAAYGPR